jgi:flavin reductase (DIM6/NTAB) family NADH-FMN oxidoreductase RutF
MPVDPADFRAVMSRFATGITVVTTCAGGQRAGITVNAFCSVSLDPPLVLICIDRSSRVHPLIVESGAFAVNFLSADQEILSACFASNGDWRFNEFCGATSHTAATGAPVLDESLGFVDCTIVDVYPGGDHSIIVGRVEALAAGQGDPLLYFESRYRRLTESTQP